MPRVVKPGSISVLDRAKIAQTGTIWCSLFQDNKTARDLVGGANIALPGGFAVQEPGTVATFNGSQAQNAAFKLPGPGLGNSIVVAARFKATATPGSSPGAAFTVGASAGSQGSIGVGIDTSNNVGAAYLTSNGAGLNARSAGALNTWYTVYAQWNNTNVGGSLTKAWINGKPATTDQGTAAFVGTTGAFDEISLGAQHRSAGFLRNFTGSIEWAALMHLETAAGSFSMTDDMAEALYEQDYPYSLLVKPKGKIWVPAAAGSTYTLTADAASYSITGADASLIVNRKLIADTANIPIAGADATLTYTPIGGPTYTLTADAGSYAITGNATGLAFNRVLTADAGSYSVAGQAVGLAFNRVLSAATANIPVAGQDVTLTYTNNGFTYTLSAEAGAFSVTGQDARLVWSGEQTGFTNEVVLKPWYIRRNKKILLFGTAQEADAYIEAEEVAEQAIQEAQKTSRRARKRLRDKLIKVEPIQTVDVDQLTEAVQRFSIPVDLPKLIAQQDYERVMQILALAADMQDEEDIETLLLM